MKIMWTSKIALVSLLLSLALVLSVYAYDDKHENISSTIQASEIISKILKGEAVNYGYVTIKGNIYLNREKLSSNSIKSSIEIKNSRFIGFVFFDDIIFNNKVDFENTEFYGDALFYKNEFDQDVSFYKSTFRNRTIFSNSVFHSNADFRDIQIIGKAYFYNTKFSSSFFSKSEFNNYITFIGAQFNDFADFYGSRFGGRALFTSAKFKNNVVFDRSYFMGDANFWNATFNGIARFNLTVFENIADFREAQFNNELDLNGIYFSDILIFWDSIKDNLSCGNSTYLALIKNFKEKGQYEDARNCYYNYKNLLRINMPLGVSTPIEYLSWISCGYGVRPSFTILWISFHILLFAVIYWRSTRDSNKLLKNKKNIILQFVGPLYFSFLVFFHIKRAPYSKKYKVQSWLFSLEELLGWFFLGLVLFVLFNKMITW